MRLAPDRVQSLAAELLVAAGASTENARDAAEVFRRATEKGIGHHDLSYLPSRLKLLQEGQVDGRARPTEVFAQGALAVFDGGGGLGESTCLVLTRRAMALAERHGVGLCSVRHSNHFLAALPYAEVIAEAGLLGVIWSNTDASMSAPGAVGMVLGNNPLGFGAPSDAHPFLLDICMAYASLGTLAALGDRPVPPHWGRDAAGQPAATARDILSGGVGHPIGGHKGYGLALMHEFLTAGLSGGEWGVEAPPLSGGVGVHSQTVLVVRPPFGASDLRERARVLRRHVADRAPRARLPGDRSMEHQAGVRRDGVEISESVQAALRQWAERLGLSWEDLLGAD